MLAKGRRRLTAARVWRGAHSQVARTSEVVYRYEVGGRVYENSRIAVAVEHGDGSLQAQERLAAGFPAGAQVPVYYDPGNPSDSALIKGDPSSRAPSWFL